MTSFTDFTDLGFFPLQDHAAAQDGTPISRRMMLAGGRIIQMTDPGDAENADEALIRYGRENGLGTLGDVHPWMFWQTRERAVRGMGSWAQAFATVAIDADPYYAKINAQPIRDSAFFNDTRFHPLDAAWPAGMQRVPRGALLTVMPGTEESGQHAVAMWTDPRLVAPNAGGPGECGTLVVDLGPDRELCMDDSDTPGIGGRHARLQSMVRVIAVAPGASFAGLGGPGNTLALNFAASGKDGIPNYGAFFGQTAGGGGVTGPTTGGPSTTTGGPITGPITGVPSGQDGPARSTFGTLQVGGGAFGAEADAGEDEKQPKEFGQFGPNQVGGHAVALMSSVGGHGPLHPGSDADKHRHGTDRDGHPINAAHISTSAYFYENSTRDAPLEFGGGYPSPDALPEVARVWLSYDAASGHSFRGGDRPGLWRWYAESPDVTPPTVSQPPSTPPGAPPTGDPPSQPPGTPVTPPSQPPTGGPTGGPTTGGPVTPPSPTRGPSLGRPITPNPGGKRFPNQPPTGPQGRPLGPTTGGPAGPSTGGGTGGQPSVPCKTQPITAGPNTGPTTGGARGPSAQVPPGPGASPVWTGGGRGGGGGGGIPPGGGAQRSERTTIMPTGAALLGERGSTILPASHSIVGRGAGGTPGQDVRMNLGRLSGRDMATNQPSEIQGVNERIGSATREDQSLYTLFRPMAQGFASINFRPQLTINGYPNFERNPQMPRSMYREDEALRPQVLTMRAYGAQSSSDSDWQYVQNPEQSRARGGTADGGILLAPPRFELSDYYGVGGDVMDVTDTTSSVATSHHVLHAPGVRTAYGLPNSNGSVQAGGSSTGYNSPTKPQITSIHTSSGTVDAVTLNYNSTGDEVVVEFGQTGAIQIPSGTTAQRPSNITPAAGMLRFNTSNGEAEIYDGTSWGALGGASGDITTGGLTMQGPGLLGTSDTSSTAAIKVLSVLTPLRLAGTTLDIAPSGVDTTELADDSVTEAKIADGAITSDKIADDNQYHSRYDTDAETARSGATTTTEIYYTARPDGDGFAESEVDDSGLGAGESSRRRLFFSDKFNADPDTSADWTQYTTQPADDTAYATCKASLLAGLSDTDGTANTRGTLPVSLKMERTVVTPLLLDTYSGATAAYSVRLLRTAYTGDALRVREDSGNTETDIGFDSNGDLDTAAIASHCGSANGYVVTWYDQSGNGRDMGRSTTTGQPQIYNGTAVLTDNGKPILTATSNDHELEPVSGSWPTWASAAYAFGVMKRAAARCIWMQADSANFRYFLVAESGSSSLYYSSVSAITLWQNGASWTVADRDDVWTGTASQSLVTTEANLSSWGSGLKFGGFAFGHRMFDMQEVVIYNSDQGSNRSGIESHINTYFSIY